jgi:uncharacterized repeat protein (TIGR01451 family)
VTLHFLVLRRRTGLSTGVATLTIVKTAQEQQALPGQPLHFAIVVGNSGPSDALGVVVGDPTPAGLLFQSNAGACTSAFPCSLGTLPVGETRTIISTYLVRSDYQGAATIRNVATATSPSDPDGPSDDDATVPITLGNAPVAVPVDDRLALFALLAGLLLLATIATRARASRTQ